MINSNLCESIKQSLEVEGVRMSQAEIQDLYAVALEKIAEMLDNGDIIDISEFGSLWRKKNESTTATFFKPTDNLLTRINK
ncbi:MAG: hypothetical protein RL662_1003 [Bacteroidota bacterium]|jgi:nucleoid DNA-binding protein